MLVVPHNDDVIGHNSLFLPVIELIAGIGNVIIHGQHDPLFPAGYREFSDKLDIVNSGFLLNSLEIQIQSVQTILLHLGHQLLNQLLPRGGLRKQNLRLHVAAEIIDQGPHLEPHVMGFLYIRSIRIGDQIIKGGVPLRFRNLVPCHAYRLIERNILIDRSHKCAHRRLAPALAQTLMLHVPDIAVRGPHLIPLLHGLQHSHLRPFLNPGNDRALDSALFPDIPLAVRHGLRLLRPVVIYENALVIGQIEDVKPDIRIIGNESQRQIDALVIHPDQRLTRASLCRMIRVDNGLRKRVNQQLFIIIPVKSFVEFFIYPFDRKIGLFFYIDSFCFLKLIIQKHRHIVTAYTQQLADVGLFL